jgi:hypothetical protein
MSITEPMTFLTDYALAAVTGTLGISLRRIGRDQRQISAKFWASAFMAIALTALVGGTCHGAGHLLSQKALAMLWKTTMLVSGLISFFILAAAVANCLPRRWHRRAISIAAIKLALYLFWISTHDEFRYVIYDYGSAIFLALCLYGVAVIHLDQKESRWVIGGLLLSIVAALLQRSGWDLSTHFNHNDLYHVIQIGAMCLLYKGVKTAVTEASMVKKRD